MVYSGILKRFSKWVFLGISILLLVIHPFLVWAQMSTYQGERAQVVLDGHVLFDVAGFGNLKPKERAHFINTILTDTVNSPDISPNVVVKRDNEQVVLEVSDRYLLTITANDVVSAIAPFQQG